MADPRVTWRITAQDQVTQTLRGIDSRIAGLTKGFKTLGGFTGFAAITAGIVSLTRKAFDLASSLQDASEKLGISATDLQKLRGAAIATGSSLESIETALVFLAKRGQEAARGSDQAALAFRRLGIDAEQLTKLPLNQQLSIIAKQLQLIPDAGQRAAAAVGLLGRGAGDLLPLLGNLDAELAKINNTLSDEQVKALDEAADEWERWGNAAVVYTGKALAAVRGFARDVAAAFANAPTAGSTSPLMPVPPWVSDQIAQLEKLQRDRNLLSKPTQFVDPITSFSDLGGLVADPWAALKKSSNEAAAVVGKPWTAAEEAARLASEKAAEAARKFAESARKAADASIAQIVQQTRSPLEAYDAEVARAIELHEKYGLELEPLNRYLQQLGANLGEATAAQVANTEAGREWIAIQDDVARVREDLVSDAERIAKAMERLNEITVMPSISIEGLPEIKSEIDGVGLTFDELIRAQSQMAFESSDAWQAVSDAAADSGDEINDVLKAIKDATQGYASEITDIFFDTTKSIGDMFESLLERIAKMLVERAIVQPIVDFIGGAIGGFVGGSFGSGSTGGSSGGIGRNVLAATRETPSFLPSVEASRAPALAAAAGPTANITFQINSLDPRTAASVIAENRNVIVGVVQQAMHRAGRRPDIA